MKASAEFADYAVELLGALDRVVSRRMFGGHGLYCDGVMFALIADDVLYLRTDESNRADFERIGSAPFVYEAKGRQTTAARARRRDGVARADGAVGEKRARCGAPRQAENRRRGASLQREH